MISFALGQELSSYEVTAKNYAEDSANKIHSDEVASVYGFSGGLVPGVGDYAYMTQPVVAALGRDWLAGGWMAAKFLKPVYDGERVCVRGRVAGLDPVSLSLELFNSAGVLCAKGEASLPHSRAPLEAADYPCHPLPDFDRRPAATIAELPAGLTLGSWEFHLSLAEVAATFLHDVRDESPVYRGPEAVCHPALLLAEANKLLHHNVALGPWIHTASEVQHYSLARDGETLSLRGRIAESYTKRGHELVTLDLGAFAGGSRPVARIKHSAIIRLREPET
jgi:hypothetical protein